MDAKTLAEDLEQGLSIRKIALKHGQSYTATKYWVDKHGLKSRFNGYSPADAPKCEECGEEDPAEFYGDRKRQCKACQIKRDVQIGIAKKKKAIEHMGGSCVVCGYNRHYGALHFHHLDPSQKEDWGSIRGWGWQRLERELAKCVLVCSNCHAEIHGGVIDDSHLVPGPPPLLKAAE